MNTVRASENRHQSRSACEVSSGPFAINAVAAKSARVAHLEEALGPRPESLRRRLRWDRAARHLEHYRCEHGITDSRDALGLEPTASEDRRSWLKAKRDLTRAGLELGRGRESTGRSGRSVER